MAHSTQSTRFARWVFTAAALYGFVTPVPMYLLERTIERMDPPAITHPEFFYGFIGVALAWGVSTMALFKNSITPKLT